MIGGGDDERRGQGVTRGPGEGMTGGGGVDDGEGTQLTFGVTKLVLQRTTEIFSLIESFDEN